MTTTYEDQEGGYVAVRSPEQLERVQAEIGEVPQDIEKNIEDLRSWALAQPHFRFKTDEVTLHRILRRSKHKIHVARKCLEDAARILSTPQLQEFFSQKEEGFTAGMMEMLKSGMFTVLPRRTSEGCRVVLTRVGKWDPSRHSFGEVVKTSIFVQEVVRADGTPLLEGKVEINDYEGTGARHLAAIPYSKMKMFGAMSKLVAGERVKGTHIVNASTITNAVLELSKLFKSEKMQARTHVHWKGVKGLVEHVDKEVLPHEYGGTAGPMEDISEESIQFLMRHSDKLERCYPPSNVFFDESKKLESSDILGTHGTYRKLSD